MKARWKSNFCGGLVGMFWDVIYTRPNHVWGEGGTHHTGLARTPPPPPPLPCTPVHHQEWGWCRSVSWSWPRSPPLLASSTSWSRGPSLHRPTILRPALHRGSGGADIHSEVCTHHSLFSLHIVLLGFFFRLQFFFIYCLQYRLEENCEQARKLVEMYFAFKCL